MSRTHISRGRVKTSSCFQMEHAVACPSVLIGEVHDRKQEVTVYSVEKAPLGTFLK